jgi:hypothetical protein
VVHLAFACKVSKSKISAEHISVIALSWDLSCLDGEGYGDGLRDCRLEDREDREGEAEADEEVDIEWRKPGAPGSLWLVRGAKKSLASNEEGISYSDGRRMEGKRMGFLIRNMRMKCDSGTTPIADQTSKKLDAVPLPIAAGTSNVPSNSAGGSIDAKPSKPPIGL